MDTKMTQRVTGIPASPLQSPRVAKMERETLTRIIPIRTIPAFDSKLCHKSEKPYALKSRNYKRHWRTYRESTRKRSLRSKTNTMRTYQASKRSIPKKSLQLRVNIQRKSRQFEPNWKKASPRRNKLRNSTRICLAVSTQSKQAWVSD